MYSITDFLDKNTSILGCKEREWTRLEVAVSKRKNEE
jgi:hypothetical protein